MASEQPPEQDDSLWDKQLWYPWVHQELASYPSHSPS